MRIHSAPSDTRMVLVVFPIRPKATCSTPFSRKREEFQQSGRKNAQHARIQNISFGGGDKFVFLGRGGGGTEIFFLKVILLCAYVEFSMEEMVHSPDPTHIPLDPRMLCIVRKIFNRSLMGSFQNNFLDLTFVYVHKTQYLKTCKVFWSLCYIYTQTVSVLTGYEDLQMFPLVLASVSVRTPYRADDVLGHSRTETVLEKFAINQKIIRSLK